MPTTTPTFFRVFQLTQDWEVAVVDCGWLLVDDETRRGGKGRFIELLVVSNELILALSAGTLAQGALKLRVL